MRRLVFSFGLLAVMASLPVSAQDKMNGNELFPVTPFNVWTYRIQGQDDKLSVSVYETKEKIGEKIYRYEGRLRGQTIVSEHLAIRKDGVYRLRHENVELDPPLLICRFPPTAGDSWKAEYKINDKKTSIAYECDTEEIVHRDAKVKAFVIRATIADVNGDIKNTCWYVPKEGLVKQVIEEGDNKIVLELESYRRPAKSKGP